MEQISNKDVERTRKALDTFIKEASKCDDSQELQRRAVDVFSREIDSPALVKRACEAYNSNKSLYKFSTGFNKDADQDFPILNPGAVSDAVIAQRKLDSARKYTAENMKPKFYKAAAAPAPMQKTASAEAAPVGNPADDIALSDNPWMLDVDTVNILDHQRELINKLAFAIDDAERDRIESMEPISRELSHMSKQACGETFSIASKHYGVMFNDIADLFPKDLPLTKFAAAPRVPNTPVFEKIANYMEKAYISENRKELLKQAAADMVANMRKLAGAYRLQRLRKKAGGIFSTAVGVGLAPTVREAFGLEEGSKADQYDRMLNQNVKNVLRELELRRNFYEVYADDYISTFPRKDVELAYNAAIQKLPLKLKKHPSSATQLVRSWVTKMLSRGNVTSAEDATDVLDAADKLRSETLDTNPYSITIKAPK